MYFNWDFFVIFGSVLIFKKQNFAMGAEPRFQLLASFNYRLSSTKIFVLMI